MSRHRDEEFVPKNGAQLRVLVVDRISTKLQDEKSNDDQDALNQEYIRARTSLPCEFYSIKSQGSGEYLDREELFELIELIESGDWDVVICEDLGRICRRIFAIEICERCEDSGTRLIAINDHVDTANEDWRMHSYFATMRHESYNKDTAKRIRRTQRNRFQQGGILPRPSVGYIRPPGAKTDDQLQKDPVFEPIVVEMFRRLEDGGTFAELADWLNSQNIPTGPSSRIKRWSVQSVTRFVRNPLLKGWRFRNRVIAKRINKTGRRKCIPAPPEELLERNCPHLAFLDPAYYDYVLALVKDRNAKKGRPKGDAARSIRLGISTKRTSFPAQHAICAVCGRTMYMTCQSAGRKQMQCSGALQYQCWNSPYIDVELTQRKLSAAVLDEIQKLDGFAESFQQQLASKLQSKSSSRQDDRVKLERTLEDLTQQIERMMDSIAKYGDSIHHRQKLKSLEEQHRVAQFELSKLVRPRKASIVIPTTDEVARLLEETFAELCDESNDEARRLICRVLPDLMIRPVELCDERTVEPQAVVTLDLQPIVNHLAGDSLPIELPPKQLIVNLFDECSYVQHVVHLGTAEQRGQLVTAAGAEFGFSLGEIGMARKLYRIMQQRGLHNPWLPLTEPPSRGWKGKRHLHPRYRFEPLPGFEPPKAA
jgi:DNA invertase Pin-like site-specific DNA recombinase